MASLKEIKGRIASVRSTLKITSAMKMVSSAKLHKAQSALGNMDLYRSQLMSILSSLLSGGNLDSPYAHAGASDRVILVCFASNSSLCGAFNSNIVRHVAEEVGALRKAGVSQVSVYASGKKLFDGLGRYGIVPEQDISSLMSSPDYASVSALADKLCEEFACGKASRIELVYNHHKSMALQLPVEEDFLPLKLQRPESEGDMPDEHILEPDASTLLSELLPKVIRLNLYNVLLDTLCAEHAARMVAMQTASDNAENLLRELRVQYNKSRQQKITNEILDLVAGSMN